MGDHDSVLKACENVRAKFHQVRNAYVGREAVLRQDILDRENKVILNLATPEQRELLQAAVRQRLLNICDAAGGDSVGRVRDIYETPEERAFQSFRFLWHVQVDLKHNKRAVQILRELEEVLGMMGIEVHGGLLSIPDWAKQGA
jgi:hypothetical protein